MLTNFETITEPLNEYEQKELLPKVVLGLSLRIGKESAISSAQIVKALTSKGYKISGPRLRKIINHIRMNGLIPCLMANSDGYYISYNHAEIVRHRESLKQRAEAILAVERALAEQWKTIQQNKQQKLFA